MHLDIALLVALLAFTLSIVVHAFDRRKVRLEATTGFFLKYAEIHKKYHEDASVYVTSGTAKPDPGETYNRQMIDLMWLEFESYKLGLLPEGTMVRWLRSRHDMFASAFRHMAQMESYPDTWDKVLDEDYFGPDSDYIEMMNLIHDQGASDEAARSIISRYRPQGLVNLLPW